MHADAAVWKLLQLLPDLFVWCLEYVIDEVKKATIVIELLLFFLIFALICLFFCQFSLFQVILSQFEAVDFINYFVTQGTLVIYAVLPIKGPDFNFVFHYYLSQFTQGQDLVTYGLFKLCFR